MKGSQLAKFMPLVCLIIFFAVIYIYWPVVETKEDNQSAIDIGAAIRKESIFRQSSYRKHIIHTVTNEMNDLWIPILKYDEIERIVPAGEQFSVGGLADKFLCEFKSGYKALMKYTEQPSFVRKEWPVLAWSSEMTNLGWYFSRSNRKLQGWTEIIAFQAEQIFGWKRKTPIVGRYISSRKLYENDVRWFGWLMHKMPEHKVPMSMHAWVEGIRQSAPGFSVYTFLCRPDKEVGLELIHREPDENFKKEMNTGFRKNERNEILPLRKDRQFLRYSGDVSDTIVFDYLFDDHDRARDHNWVSDSEGNLLIWDSGLIFSHGPLAKESCSKLLCGPERFRAYERKVLKYSGSCRKICRFRNSTVHALRKFQFAEHFNETLGGLLKARLEQDLIHPLQYNIYYLNRIQEGEATKYRGYPKIKFREEDFYDGLNRRVSKLISHISRCVEAYGEEKVIDTRLEDRHRHSFPQY